MPSLLLKTWLIDLLRWSMQMIFMAERVIRFWLISWSLMSKIVSLDTNFLGCFQTLEPFLGECVSLMIKAISKPSMKPKKLQIWRKNPRWKPWWNDLWTQSSGPLFYEYDGIYQNKSWILRKILHWFFKKESQRTKNWILYSGSHHETD